MSDNLLRKIKNLLDLANDADDEESMTALAKAQELMILYNVSEDDILQQKQSHSEGIVLSFTKVLAVVRLGPPSVTLVV